DGQMPEDAFKALGEVITKGETYEALAGLNSLDAAVTAGQMPAAKAQELVRPLNLKEPAGRIQRHLLAPDA
ncbi:MAG TPA: hypothetical protein VK956_15155, partial [Verrucomicrobium sp.]|nr:hypothetical protein [Verrucomicrobium sp.]